MTTVLQLRLAAIGVAIGSAALATQAAAIECQNGFQRVQGSYLATPYCQDALLATVARQFGMKVSAYEIRENPNYKRHVCRLVGRDIRVQETCMEVNPNSRGRSF